MVSFFQGPESPQSYFGHSTPSFLAVSGPHTPSATSLLEA